MTEAPAPHRNPVVDSLKAIAIVAVVLQHVRFPAIPDTGLPFLDPLLTSRWLGFHVPTFLLVSGFLYSRARALRAGEVAARLKRLLVPYLLASTFIFTLGVTRHLRPELGEQFMALITGSAIGTYYYVFVASICLCLSWPLSRVPAAWLTATMFASAVLSVASRYVIIDQSYFWAMRDPTNFYVAYFVIGWWAGAHRAALSSWAARHRTPLLVFCCATLIACRYLDQPGIGLQLAGTLRFLFSLTAVSFISLLWAGRDTTVPAGWPIILLSRATYPIFLYHMVVIRNLVPITSVNYDAQNTWLASGILALVALGSTLAVAAVIDRFWPRAARFALGMG